MVRAEKEEWKASPSRGFAGMRADERPCASATRALPGASSTKRRGSWRAVAARGLRGPQPEQGAAAGVASAAAKRVVEMPRTLKDNEAPPACRLRKRRAPLNDRGFEGGLPLRSLQRGAGGNGGDRPCLPAPVPVCGPASSGQGVAKERVTRLILKKDSRKGSP